MSTFTVDFNPEFFFYGIDESYTFPTGANGLLGQSITGSGHALSYASVQLSKVGNPTGSIYAHIYAHTGTFGTSSIPTGSPLATSNARDAVDIESGVTNLLPFSFFEDNRINLGSGTKFVLVLDVSSVSQDGSNYLTIGVPNNPGHSGNFSTKGTGSWVADSGRDFEFSVFGTDTASVATLASSSRSSTKVTLNGTIGGVGTSSVDERGFVYDVTPRSYPGNTAPGSSGYANSQTNSGSFSAESFSSNITGLQSDKKYYVRAYAHNSSGYVYGEEVEFLTLNLTRVSFASVDVTDIFKSILDSFTERGGIVDYDGSSTDDTGVTVNYTFNTATILEGIKTCLALAPSDWYWYVDVGSEVAYFKQTSTTADHVLVFGRHIEELDLKLSIADVKNLVYFTGGDTGGGDNLFKIYQDDTSIAAYGQRLKRITDNRITLTSTADIYGNAEIDRNKDEKYYTTVDILDGTYDITLFKPGDVIGFAGFGSFVDSLLLQIARIQYTPTKVTLTLGELPYRAPDKFEQFRRELFDLQTVDNPDEPS